MTSIEVAAKHGAGLTETTRRARGRKPPSFMRIVAAPVAIFATTTGTCVGGSVLTAANWGDWYAVAWSLALTAGGIAGFVAAWYAVPEYWDLQYEHDDRRLEPRQPGPDSGRELYRVSRNIHRQTRCQWAHDWKRRLARRLHDDEGNWTGGDKPARWMFDKLVTNVAEEYRDSVRHVQADLYDMGWIDASDLWTEKARAELGAALFYPAG